MNDEFNFSVTYAVKSQPPIPLPDYSRLPEFLAFANAIHENPECAANKGVMADWLDDLGYENQAAELRRQMGVDSYDCEGLTYTCQELYALNAIAFAPEWAEKHKITCHACEHWNRLLTIIGYGPEVTA